ncbi:hypothetical protein J3R30DRAFT_3418469 [Lentinula aciculospora]|uniref:Capsular associated protein n=1 Tax=Lentinula aciculospora TaxID=153920 RepID=A0A9W9ATN9_9AGAR|nr:hypothetical protein J3R30DRAFT_3418469 [Lentinula aciculospora]
MYRRAKTQAHISSPSPDGMGSDNEKFSRLPQRPLGVTNRIWVVVGVVIFIFGCTHYILPSAHNAANMNTYSNSNLKAKNYLNTTEPQTNPFDFCPAYGPGDQIGAKYGTLVLSQSRIHLGSSARIQRVLSRALAGQPVTISILGGSVSACHGAGDDPISPRCYPSKFFQWWNSVFPHPASELTNGAIRRTNSAYFAYCSTHHIPDITDLIIVELDVDDAPDAETTEHFETLIRSLLIRPDAPAVLLLGHFSPQIHNAYGFVGPDHWHNVVAQFYDVPHVSTKSALFSDYMNDPASITKYYIDPILANPSGHELLSDVLIAYIQSQICTAWAVLTGSSYDTVPQRHADSGAGDNPHGLFGGMGQRKGVVPEPGMAKGKEDVDVDGNRIKLELPDTSKAHVPLLHVPAGRMNTKPNDARPYEEIAPYCVSANDLVNPLPLSLFSGSGWFSFHPTGASAAGGAALETKAHYWYSSLPTSKIRIPILVGAGDIGVYYILEPKKDVGEGSSVQCWVDDNFAGAKTLENAADVGEPKPKLFMIDHYVSRGNHFVECQLKGEEGQGVPMFRIIGIFSS